MRNGLSPRNLAIILPAIDVYPMATHMVKTAALRIRIEPELHKKFLDTCKSQDVPASQVLREFMKQYVSDNAQTPQLDFFQQKRHAHVD